MSLVLHPAASPRALLQKICRDFGSHFAMASVLATDCAQIVHHIAALGTKDLDRFVEPQGQDSLAREVLRTNTVLAIPSVRTSAPVPDCPFMRAEGLQSYLGVPIRLDDSAFGVLSIAKLERRDWTDRQITALRNEAAVFERLLTGPSNNVLKHMRLLSHTDVITQELDGF